MALKSRVFKFTLNVADLDRQVYGDFPLTLALHPSEQVSRLMLRLLVFALYADDNLKFGRGISTDDEPDLWQQDLTGNILLWIDLGTPDPERLRKACGRAKRVVLYCYGDRATGVWWEKHGAALQRFSALQVYRIDDSSLESLAALAASGAALQCTVQDGEAWLSCGDASVQVLPVALKS